MEENDLEGKEDLEKLEKFTKEFQDLIKLAKTQQVLTKRILHLSKLHKK